MNRGHIEGAGIEMEDKQQVACGAGHSESEGQKDGTLDTFSKGSKNYQEHVPPDISFGHDALKSVTELKEGIDLKME